MTHLCTTALTEFWDPGAARHVALGWWCLRHDRQEEWRSLDLEVLPHPWDDRAAMHRAARYEAEVYEDLLAALAVLLDRAHGQRHSLPYWRIIIGPWLRHFVQVIHERYRCLTQAIDLLPDLETTGLAEDSFQVPSCQEDHLLGSFDDPYNLQIYTSIFRTLGRAISTRSLQWRWPEAPTAKPAAPLSLLRRLWFECSLPWACRAPVLMVALLANRDALRLMLLTRLSARRGDIPTSSPTWRDSALAPRHPHRPALRHAPLNHPGRFPSLLLDLLPDYLPLAYLESYPILASWAARIAVRAKTKVIITAHAFFTGERSRFLIGALVERGAKLVYAQHGGCYGSAKENTLERLEREAADDYWSWGWTEHGSRVYPMPSPRLRAVKANRGPVPGNYILFVGNVVPRYHYRTGSYPTAGQALRYFEWRARFVSRLEARVLSALRVRLYPTEYGWATRERLLEVCPGVQLDPPGEDYIQRLTMAGLVICDTNQTTLLEALAADVPVVAFWDPDLHELRPEAEPYYRELEEAGLLYHDPEAAARAVNLIWPDVDHWWERGEVRAARKRFMNVFARTSPEWSRTWAQAMLKMKTGNYLFGVGEESFC